MARTGISRVPARRRELGVRRGRPIRSIHRIVAATACAALLWVGATTGAFAATSYAALTSVTVATSPYGIAVYAAGGRVFVADYGSNAVSVISTSTNTVVGTVAVGTEPVGVAVDQSTGTVYVTNSGAGTVSVIDATTNTATATIALADCPGPALPTFDAGSGRLYVPCDDSGNVVVIDPATASVIATIPLGSAGLWASAVLGGRLYVSNYITGSVSIIDLASGTVAATLSVGGQPVGLTADPSTGSVYVAQRTAGTVTVINGTAVSATWNTGGAPNDVAVSADGTAVLVPLRDSTTMLVLDPASGSTIGTVTMPVAGPDRIAVDPTTGTAYVSNWVSGGTGNTVTVVAASPTITTGAVPAGVSGTAYSTTIAATGTPAISYAVTAGSLPAGLSLNSSTGVISGTPTIAGSSTFTVTATNAAGSDAHAYTLVVRETPTITTTTLADGVTGTTYSATIAATGTSPITYAVTSGALPAGLSLAPSTGALTGVPTSAGTFTFTVRATNAVGSDDQAFTLIIRQPPTVTTTTMPDAVTGTAYSEQIAAQGTAPITFSVISGALPDGLHLDPATGVVSGTPSVAGTFDVTVAATNSVGSANVTLRLVVRTPPTITSTTLAPTVVGSAYAGQIQASGSAPMTFAVTAGALPPGLVIDSHTGVISGVATASGSYQFTVSVTNAAGIAVAGFVIDVSPAPVMVLPDAAPPSEAVTQPVAPTLASTGVDGGVARVGAALVGIGAALVVLARRRPGRCAGA